MSKAFKVTMSLVYNDGVTEEQICDDVFNTMKNINNKLVILNIDDVKEIKRPNQIIKKTLSSINQETFENVEINNEIVKINKK